MAGMDEQEAKPQRGRPKNVIPDDVMARALQMALWNCNDCTIETALGWRQGFIAERRDISAKIKQKRAEHRQILREAQFKQVKNPAMAIFLGKNALGQADKQDHRLALDEETRSLLDVIDGKTKGVLPSAEVGD